MKKDRIFRIANFGKSSWIYPLVNEINKNDKLLREYQKRDLSKRGISISNKLDFLELLTRDLNELVSKMKRELKGDMENANQCIDENKTYRFENEEDVFLLLGYIESAIFQLRSIYDLLLKYVNEFGKILLLKGINENQLLNECIKKGLGADWSFLLKTIREDFFHNYSGWLLFKKVNNDFEILIELPKLRNGRFKKYPNKCLSQKDIIDLFKGFFKFANISRDYLIQEIQKYNTRVK